MALNLEAMRAKLNASKNGGKSNGQTSQHRRIITYLSFMNAAKA